MTSATIGGFFDHLLNTVGDTVKTDAISWLFQQYATLQAMPQTLARQRQAIGTIGRSIPPTDGETLQRLSAASTKNVSLSGQYSAMIGAVNQAYQLAQQLQSGGWGGTAINNAASIAMAIYGAQQFVQEVTDVDDTIKSVVDHLLATGAITADEAQSLYARSQEPSAGWGRWLLYAGVGYVGYRVLKGVL